MESNRSPVKIGKIMKTGIVIVCCCLLGTGIAVVSSIVKNRGAVVYPESHNRQLPDYLKAGASPFISLNSVEPFALASCGEGLLISAKMSLSFYRINGEEIWSIDLDDTPRAVVLLSDNRILVAFDTQIQEYGFNGVYQRIWSDLGGETRIVSMTVQNGDVFVTDAGNGLVYRFSSNGRLKNLITGGSVNHFLIPSPYFSIAPAADGNLWIANPGHHRVELITPEGELLSFWGGYSETPEGFIGCCNPVHILTLSDGRIITREKGIKRIKIYSPQGKLLRVLLGEEYFSAYSIHQQMAVHDNRLFYLDGRNLNVVDLMER
jgi:hypothetical protein